MCHAPELKPPPTLPSLDKGYDASQGKEREKTWLDRINLLYIPLSRSSMPPPVILLYKVPSQNVQESALGDKCCGRCYIYVVCYWLYAIVVPQGCCAGHRYLGRLVGEEPSSSRQQRKGSPKSYVYVRLRHTTTMPRRNLKTPSHPIIHPSSSPHFKDRRNP